MGQRLVTWQLSFLFSARRLLDHPPTPSLHPRCLWRSSGVWPKVTHSFPLKPGCSLGLGFLHKYRWAGVFQRPPPTPPNRTDTTGHVSVCSRTDCLVIFTDYIHSLLSQSGGFNSITSAKDACLSFDSDHWAAIHKAIDELFMKRESKSPLQLFSMRGRPQSINMKEETPPQHCWLKMSKTSHRDESYGADGITFVCQYRSSQRWSDGFNLFFHSIGVLERV